MEEDFYKRAQMVMDAFRQRNMLFTQKQESTDAEETATASDVYNEVNPPINEQKHECEVDNCEQLQPQSENQPIQVEQLAFLKCNDEFDAWKDCYVKVTRLKQSVLEEHIEKQLQASQSLDTNNQYKHSKQYRNGKRLTAHVDVIESGAKPYRCIICRKHFKRNGDLTNHLRTHTGTKPYRCGQCGKYFTQSGSLKVHIRIHTGIKPYKCEHCGICFTDKSNLTNHVRIHTGDKRYKCEECGKRFQRNEHLNRHLRVHM